MFVIVVKSCFADSHSGHMGKGIFEIKAVQIWDKWADQTLHVEMDGFFKDNSKHIKGMHALQNKYIKSIMYLYKLCGYLFFHIVYNFQSCVHNHIVEIHLRWTCSTMK